MLLAINNGVNPMKVPKSGNMLLTEKDEVKDWSIGVAGDKTRFWIYVICWIAIPKALTATQKCEMYGLPVTAENLARFAQSQNK